MQFLYEDGQEHAVDENGVEPMDLAVDEELFAIETIGSRTQFLMNKPPERLNPVMHPVTDKRKNEDIDMGLYNKRYYTVYSDEDKTRFFRLFFSKCLNASAAARQSGPESIFEKKKKSGRRRILGEEHKQFLLNYIDENPSAVVTEVVESLLQNSVNLKVSRSTVYNFMTTQCNLSIKQAQFQPVERNSEEKIQQRYGWVQKWLQTDLDFTTNCVFLDESAFHTNLKRGTVTVHYLSFLKATLNEMDKYPEMRGHYLVMDNAPIHSSTDIGKYIHSRGYRYVYLPPYSPEMNPIEQFWSVVKSKVKRNKFLEKESLMTRISEACDSLYLSDFQGFVSHSAKCFRKCLNKERL
ncbi:hypothetical protein G6F56_010995 [Rhizopus delemar]|nr:hypothetical protein G6F56_010995 [Rhizopus delemar]